MFANLGGRSRTPADVRKSRQTHQDADCFPAVPLPGAPAPTHRPATAQPLHSYAQRLLSCPSAAQPSFRPADPQFPLAVPQMPGVTAHFPVSCRLVAPSSRLAIDQ